MLTKGIWIGSVAGAYFRIDVDDDETCDQTGNKFYDAASWPGTPICDDVVFADADKDGDVDHEDFAVLQICLTGPGGGIPSEPEYCQCLDRQNDGSTPGQDGDIDSWDYIAFEVCATGPEVPFDPDNPPTLCVH